MSQRSAIEWTDATWNPVTGCDKVSPGCDHCYAETFTERWRGVPGHHFERGFDLVLRPERLGQPLKWRAPRRVFVNSMSDLFHPAVPDEFIAEVFAVMAAAPRHTFQVLTKRHGRLRSLLRSQGFRDLVQGESADLANEGVDVRANNPWENWPLPNVWLGVSAENQRWAEIRIPALVETPAAVRFVSAEPLLGPIDLTRAVWTCGSERGHGLTARYVHAGGCCRRFHGIDWVITGGESGPSARPAHPDWFRSIRDQCQDAGVAFFHKQWGAWVPFDGTPHYPYGPGAYAWILPSGKQSEPGTLGGVWMRRTSKKSAGRLLDGRTHNDMPAGSEAAWRA
ncbi:DUF5131 family protein [Actinomadura rubrisoli]|uniref:Phage Gp37/Gp68 family protein n=1 Tax=Actinomadura rubrisoli TaxID=2530368 RepID=A0A4R5AEX2_9ACTN|nr:phage Gp37/Gp68 family protein [Actinomadura rubrisoli]TDD70881.1 phage Gp37/Gp68 family protein [Actinomadura rubrisoli]